MREWEGSAQQQKCEQGTVEGKTFFYFFFISNFYLYSICIVETESVAAASNCMPIFDQYNQKKKKTKRRRRIRKKNF